MKPWKVAAGVSAAALTIGLATQAGAFHRWSTYHWARTTSSFDLQMIDSVTPFWQFEYDTSLAEWSQSTKLNLVNNASLANDTSRVRKQCRMSAGRARVCNAAYGLNGWLGLASINIDSNSHITQGTAKMNDSYSSYWADPNEQRHVMCQEIGHVFGLGHTSEDGTTQDTCMDYSSSPTSISPNAHDYEELVTMYNHLDTYNTYTNSSSFTSSKADVSDHIPPGALKVKHNKFEEEWVKPDGEGGWWIFHVRLAPEGYDKK